MEITAPARLPNAQDALDAYAFALLRDKARAMFAYNHTSLVAHLAGIAIILSMFSAVTSLERRLGWGALFGVLWLARTLLALAWSRSAPATLDDYHRWLRRWNTGTLLTAVMWGAAAWVFWGDGDATRRIALVLVIYSFCVACVPVLAPQFRLFLGYVLLMFVPVIARVAASLEPLDLQLAFSMLLILGLTIVLGRNYRAATNHVLELKLRAEQLMEQLRAEKAVSDAARQ
jgi:two-component system, sensor histidine kinase